MGSIVGGFGTAHILMKRGTGGEAGERVFAGMRHIGRQARELSPDVAVIVSSDHLYNFSLGMQSPLMVVVADELVPFGDLGLPRDPLRGHRAFAQSLVRHAASVGFDLAVAEAYRPDHGIVLPALMLSPDRSIPIVPLIVNTAMEPGPSARRCFDLGVAIREMVEQIRPAAERVIVIGTGGLSHWLGVSDMGRINSQFDERVLRAFEQGDVSSLATLSRGQIVEEGGNGGLELLCWLVMGGAMRHTPAQRVYYEAVAPWITGMGGVAAIRS